MSRDLSDDLLRCDASSLSEERLLPLHPCRALVVVLGGPLASPEPRSGSGRDREAEALAERHRTRRRFDRGQLTSEVLGWSTIEQSQRISTRTVCVVAEWTVPVVPFMGPDLTSARSPTCKGFVDQGERVVCWSFIWSVLPFSEGRPIGRGVMIGWRECACLQGET